MTTPAPLPPSAARQMRAAVAAQQRGDYERADSLYEALIRAHPEFPDAWHYWGLLAHQQGRKAQTLERFERARSLEPDNLVFLLNLGRALREQGDFQRSIACLDHAYRVAPEHAQALLQLAQSYLAVERGGELVPDIERHLERAAADWHLWMLLGECREQAGDRPGALAAFAEAANLAPPGECRPYLRRADAALKAADQASAARDLERALAIDAASAEARLGLARLAAEAGDFERTERLVREALAHDPRQYDALAVLARSRRITREDPLLAELDEAAAAAGEAPRTWLLHYTRGEVWEKLGDYERAFAAYEQGNRIHGNTRPYARQGEIDYFRDLKTALDEAFVARAARTGLGDSPVIFVCGMPRSGTTLVETILASHPAVAAGGEQRYIHDRLRREVGVMGLGRTGSWLRALSDERLREWGEDWRGELGRLAAGRPWITDKMPSNYMLLGFIHVLFPQAPVVHVRRDARDNCFSCYATPFAEGHSFAFRLADTGRHYRLYEALMAHWRRVLPPGRIIEVEYEKLVAEPETEIRRLLDAVGLDWDPRCLAFHQTSRRVATASVFQVRRPLYTTSIGRAKRFERHLGPLLAELEGAPPI